MSTFNGYDHRQNSNNQSYVKRSPAQPRSEHAEFVFPAEQSAMQQDPRPYWPGLGSDYANYPLLGVHHQQPSPDNLNDESAFPSLGLQNPAVKMPPRPPSPKHSGPGSGGVNQMSGLAERMRSLILRNQNTSSEAKPVEMSKQIPRDQPPTKPPSMRRENQKTRKQKQLEGQQIKAQGGMEKNDPNPAPVQPRTPMQKPHNVNRNDMPYTGAYGTNLPPHLRGQWHAPQMMMDPMQVSRPPPRNRQLYQPQPQQAFQIGQAGYRNQRPPIPNMQDQLEYISFIAEHEFFEAEMSPDELDLKETLRKKLETHCRIAVAEHEKPINADFPPESVTLERFGSLATTFATKNSDMDLVLTSPFSAIDASSTDSPLPRLIERALLDGMYGARLLTRTRVPIIKFCELPTPDLFERLAAARSNWEMEKEVPVAATRSQKGKTKAKDHVSIGDCIDPILPHHGPNSSDGVGLSNGGVSLDQDQKSLKMQDPLGNGVTTTSGKDALSSPASTPLPNQQLEGNLTARTGQDLECDDMSLHSKSDEERVRLYRLAMKEDWYSAPERRIILDFINAYESSASTSSDLDYLRSQLGILPNVLKRYRPPPPKHLDYPKIGVGIQCDINFSNSLGLHNSTLLRCYSLCDPRVRPMVIFIKSWAKKRRINSAYESSLSSYGYVLMALHYLINVASPPVLPNLQHYHLSPEPNAANGPKMVDGHVVHFFRDEAILQNLKLANQITQNYDQISVLLHSFFAYYGSNNYPYFNWMRECISLRTLGGTISKESKNWVAAKSEHVATGLGLDEKKEVRQRYLVAIEDPFEIEHNVGRTVSHDGICAIRDEFRRAWRLISHAGMGPKGKEEFLEEVMGRGHLQYRYFGPNPRKGVPINDGWRHHVQASREKKAEAEANQTQPQSQPR